MAEWCCYIITYDDLDLLKGAVASIPDGVTTYVLDGRYADFPGKTLNTPGCREWCADQPDVIYDSPPDRLPWGHEHWQDEPELRHPIHAQATYANYELLPQGKWVLHLGADERLEAFEADVGALDRRSKYCPYIDSLAERQLALPRLYVPKYWTFWIDAVMYPREFWPRSTPLSKLAALHVTSLAHQFINREQLFDEVRIRNVGDTRPPEYHERRADQLETMGRTDRAEQYRAMVASRE